jgi:hypothetical protein
LPSSFRGSSSGIPVKLHMGMYSVTETSLPGYNITLSDDRSGGIMSVQTKKCIITNFYSQHINTKSNNTNPTLLKLEIKPASILEKQ